MQAPPRGSCQKASEGKDFLHLVRAAWLLDSLTFTYSHGSDALFLSVSDVPLGRAVGTVPAQKGAAKAAAQLRAGRQELAAMDAQEQDPSSPASCSALHCPSTGTVKTESLAAGWLDLV